MSPQWRTPAAIVLAGAFIAVAIYLGLRRPSDGDAVGPTEPNAARPSDPRARAVPSVAVRSSEDDEASAERSVAHAEAAPSPTPPDDAQRRGAVDPALAVAPSLSGLPPVPADVVQRVEEDVLAEFASIRDRVRAKCWDPLPDTPDTVEVGVSLSYAADGRVLASGIVEDRAHDVEGLAACLRPVVHGLNVPPPGNNVAVQVRLTLP